MFGVTNCCLPRAFEIPCQFTTTPARSEQSSAWQEWSARQSGSSCECCWGLQAAGNRELPVIPAGCWSESSMSSPILPLEPACVGRRRTIPDPPDILRPPTFIRHARGAPGCRDAIAERAATPAISVYVRPCAGRRSLLTWRYRGNLMAASAGLWRQV